MKLTSTALLLLTMWFSSNVWAMYGIGLAVRDDLVPECTTCILQSSHTPPTPAPESSLDAFPFQSPLPTGHHNESSTLSTVISQPSQTPSPTYLPAPPPQHTEPISYATPIPLSSSPSSFETLSPTAKAGIITGPILALLITFLVLLECGYLRRKRRERALRRAVEEVERGDIEMARRGESEMAERSMTEREVAGRSANGSLSGDLGESKENMVLESRVEILVVEESEAGDEGEWDAGSDADADGEGEESEDGWSDWGVSRRREGRCAMSLPRREY